MPELIRKKKKMSSFEMIAFGFSGVILLGAITGRRLVRQ